MRRDNDDTTDDTTSGPTREHPDEELAGSTGVGTDGSLHSAHHSPDDDESREGPGVGTDGSLENHDEQSSRDPE